MQRAGTRPVLVGEACIDMVRALALAGLRSDVVAPAGEGSQYSRYAQPLFDWDWSAQGSGERDAEVLERLTEGRTESVDKPVLFCCCEPSLRFVSRHRERLARSFRLVLPDAELIDKLSDKIRFASLAEELGLPVPQTRAMTFAEAVTMSAADALSFPLILKPALRDASWNHSAKAIRIDTPAGLDAFAKAVPDATRQVVVQRLIEGPESSIESYHVFVRPDGEVVAEFTGRKLRTWPLRFGHSTALTTTDAADVLGLGRQAIRALGLTGVAKLDFKRSAGGELHLLEVNARFNLWHHLGARIGVNIPALVYADATGRECPSSAARTGSHATWVHPKDILAARASGLRLGAWARWAYRADAKAYWSKADPVPLLAAGARPLLRQILVKPGKVRR